MDIDDIKKYLKDYDGPEVALMEVCGSHTAAIARDGIKAMLSPRIKLIAGPGCPVCVTPSSYIDRLIELAETPDTWVVTFGDMIRIPGSACSLGESRSQGAKVTMVYSPADIIRLAKKHPDIMHVFAAVGFETTAPAYALLMDRLIAEDIENVRLLTALKTMPPVIDWLCANGAEIDGFIAPGHVSVITGSEVFRPLAEKYSMPFAVAGFEGEEILTAIYGLVKSIGRGEVMNYYPQVVTAEGNQAAKEKLARYFRPYDAVWRGMGAIPGSGIILKDEYAGFDAGSAGLSADNKYNSECMCGTILTGRAEPEDCPLFAGKVCTPQTPQGACMVSFEGSCYQSYITGVVR
jgi:hydrogenase expression/formation protein HypD